VSFKVADFGTNPKLICDFLLVINTNLFLILHRVWDIGLAFDRSKTLYFATPLVAAAGDRSLAPVNDCGRGIQCEANVS